MENILNEINESAEGSVLLTGLDDAILGIVEEFGNDPRVLYSKEKIINILIENEGMSKSEALEYYDFNILGMYVSDQNPVFLTTDFR
jgi:hypothetical protein